MNTFTGDARQPSSSKEKQQVLDKIASEFQNNLKKATASDISGSSNVDTKISKSENKNIKTSGKIDVSKTIPIFNGSRFSCQDIRLNDPKNKMCTYGANLNESLKDSKNIVNEVRELEKAESESIASYESEKSAKSDSSLPSLTTGCFKIILNIFMLI